MIGLNSWDIFAFIGFIFLVLFFYSGRNLAWTAFSISLVLALIICGIYFLKNNDWPWLLFKKTIIIVTYIGIVTELIIRLYAKMKRK